MSIVTKPTVLDGLSRIGDRKMEQQYHFHGHKRVMCEGAKEIVQARNFGLEYSRAGSRRNEGEHWFSTLFSGGSYALIFGIKPGLLWGNSSLASRPFGNWSFVALPQAMSSPTTATQWWLSHKRSS